MAASVDDVSLIKDRDTGESRKFAFVRFTSVGHAIQFVEKNRSFSMDSYRVRVDYCKKNQQEDTKEEWRCFKVLSFLFSLASLTHIHTVRPLQHHYASFLHGM